MYDRNSKKTETAQDRREQRSNKPPPSTLHQYKENNDQDKAIHLTDNFLITKTAETKSCRAKENRGKRQFT
ncbi:hypothetical protein OIU78_017643 [Salix suchowensis]|nr:hypothetical protein OIU78_017643 [Salix suchowensis]